MNIRKAELNDIESIAIIKVNGWQAAYQGIVDSEYLNAMTVLDQINQIKKSYALENIFVAEQDGEVLGFCRICNYDNTDCEIREIYVKADMKRMGIGSKLFRYVLHYFKQNNKRRLYLCCFKENYDSRSFYEKMGGILGEEQKIEIGGKLYKLVSYVYDLSV